MNQVYQTSAIQLFNSLDISCVGNVLFLLTDTLLTHDLMEVQVLENTLLIPNK